MGSQTPEGHQQKPNGSVMEQKPANTVAKPRTGSFPDDQLGGASDDDDSDDDGQNPDAIGVNDTVGGAGELRSSDFNTSTDFATR